MEKNEFNDVAALRIPEIISQCPPQQPEVNPYPVKHNSRSDRVRVLQRIELNPSDSKVILLHHLKIPNLDKLLPENAECPKKPSLLPEEKVLIDLRYAILENEITLLKLANECLRNVALKSIVKNKSPS